MGEGEDEGGIPAVKRRVEIRDHWMNGAVARMKFGSAMVRFWCVEFDTWEVKRGRDAVLGV